MKTLLWVRAALLSLLAVAALTLGGCGSGDTKGPEAGKPATPAADSSCSVAENWCIEHGVPEDVCGQCNAKVAAECQQKGDWCKEHSRPKSQCFLCDPKLEAKFVAEYEAKYGKKPPKAEGKKS
jgi:hypothetical protein